MLRILVVLIALTGTAAGYPLTIPRQSTEVRAAREAEFLRRNPQYRLQVATDENGFISHVSTDHPHLVPKQLVDGAWPEPQLQQLRMFLKSNADAFGIPPEAVDRAVTGLPDMLLVDTIDGQVLGEIQISYSPLATPVVHISTMYWIAAEPKLRQAAIAARVARARYVETIGYGWPPEIDCAMTIGPDRCKTPVRHYRRREITVAADHVRAVTQLHRRGDRVRLVAYVEVVDDDPPAAAAWTREAPLKHTFAPIGNAPRLPLVVELVTGEQLAATTCLDPAFTEAR